MRWSRNARLQLGLYLRWGLQGSTGSGRLRGFSAQVVADNALHDGVLLSDEGILAVVIGKQAAFELGLDPALKLGTSLRTDISHALVILSHDSRPFLRGRGCCECGVLLGFDIVDEGKAEFRLDIVFECVYPWLGARTVRGERRWQIRLAFARGKGERCRWGLVK